MNQEYHSGAESYKAIAARILAAESSIASGRVASGLEQLRRLIRILPDIDDRHCRHVLRRI